MRLTLAVTLPVLLAATPLVVVSQDSHRALPSRNAARATAPTVESASRAKFAADMRQLWEDHVTWTRLYIVAAVAGLQDAGPAAQRLLQNQTDIGNAVKPFYGAKAGDALTALLRSHILIAADLVTAAKAGNTTATGEADTRWYANSNEIADFLSSANPRNWPREVMRAEMKHHLDLTLQEAQARLKSDWAADIAAYDAIHAHILKMADVLASGIINQFPKQF